MDAALPHIRGYRILELIGKGGMGEVFLAEDMALERRVAIKRIASPLVPAHTARSRFLREARAMAGIEHPNVVRVYALGEGDGQPYIVMEYVPGVTLAARLAGSRRLALDDALRIAREVALALATAWSRGIIHRDVKPANILLDHEHHVKVADFGLARLPRGDGDETGAGIVLGTAHYISPEQARGDEVDFRSDVYSLGIVLYEMLGGRKPFTGRSPIEVLARHLAEPLPPIRAVRPEVPPGLATLVEWMTAKTPAARPTSYPELLRHLVPPGTSGDLPESATSTMPSLPAAPRPARTMPSTLKGAAIGVLGAMSVAALSLTPGLWRTRHGSFAVAVAPFYGADPESEKEGRVLAALVESELTRRLPEDDVDVMGTKEVAKTVRTPRAARALARRLDVDVLVWGEALAFQGEVELAARITRRDGSLLELSGPGGALSTATPLALRRTRATAVVDRVAESYRTR